MLLNVIQEKKRFWCQSAAFLDKRRYIIPQPRMTLFSHAEEHNINFKSKLIKFHVATHLKQFPLKIFGLKKHSVNRVEHYSLLNLGDF